MSRLGRIRRLERRTRIGFRLPGSRHLDLSLRVFREGAHPASRIRQYQAICVFGHAGYNCTRFIKKARKVMASCVTLSIILHVPSCVPSAALYCASSKIQLSSIFHGNGHSDRHNRQNPKPPAHDHILFPSRSIHRKSLCQNVKYPNQGLLIWAFCSFTCGRAAGSWQRCRQSPQNRRPSTAYPASTRQRARPRPARPPKSCCLAPGRCAGRRPGIG